MLCFQENNTTLPPVIHYISFQPPLTKFINKSNCKAWRYMLVFYKDLSCQLLYNLMIIMCYLQCLLYVCNLWYTTTIISKQPDDAAIKWKGKTILYIAYYLLWKTFAFFRDCFSTAKVFWVTWILWKVVKAGNHECFFME